MKVCGAGSCGGMDWRPRPRSRRRGDPARQGVVAVE